MKTKDLLLIGLFGALTAVFAQIVLPIGAVPISLATLGVMLSAGFLGGKRGVLSQIIYVLVGAIGLPLFHGMQGGIGVLLGPTGGFLVGYIGFAWVTGRLTEKGWSFLFASALGTAVCYLFGSIWFWIVTGGTVRSVLLACVLPFLPGDSLKILLAGWLYRRLKGKIFL